MKKAAKKASTKVRSATKHGETKRNRVADSLLVDSLALAKRWEARAIAMRLEQERLQGLLDLAWPDNHHAADDAYFALHDQRSVAAHQSRMCDALAMKIRETMSCSVSRVAS